MTFDGIILGTGHNALVLQAYLSRCGLKTLSLDRAALPGGGLATIEHPGRPGFLHNPHAFFLRGITRMPWFRDLELKARLLEPELNVAMVTKGGRTLEWWTDLERTADSFAAFSRPDAAALRRWATEMKPVVERILIPEAQSPPLPPARRCELLRRSEMGRFLLKLSALSPLEFVRREFRNDAVRAGLLFFNGLREVDLRLRGFGHAIPALLASPARAQMCMGGSARLAEALVRDIEAHGGVVRCGVSLKAIVMRRNRAAGIELADGERIEARGFVASGLNPQQTFVDLLPGHPAGRRAAKFRYNRIAPLFGLYLALSEPAKGPKALMVIHGLDRLSQWDRIVQAHERDAMPPMVMWGSCPTLFDPSQAPRGRHTAFLWQKVPFARDWPAEREAHAARMLKEWPGRGAVLDTFVRTPRDIVETLPNMQEADLLVGSFDHGQVGANRPFPGAGRYRTPVRGLYLCGGSTHPGGNITGLCGYNAASVIAADVGVKRWWTPPDLDQALNGLD